jgi:hypothetical protein
MKRSAWRMVPERTWSGVTSMGTMGRPAASALVQLRPRRSLGTLVASQTARQPPSKVPSTSLARHISNSSQPSVSSTVRWQSPSPAQV